jgi:hypothetical protein
MSESLAPAPSDFLLYAAADGKVRVEAIYHEETIWLSQKKLAELFNVDVRTVNEHLINIYLSNELPREATIRKFRIVQKEGNRDVTREIDFYNLDAIIAVGYRVNSYQATQFRIWATATLKEFMIKGFVLDDERLKQGKKFGQDYFDELLERIREIRASERRFYQKITDIYKECSADFDPKAPVTQTFFATVQNKLEWAITGKTAAEIIHSRANAELPHMGLTTWKNAPDGKVLQSDAKVAKNYLNEDEIKELNLIVTMYLDFAELQAKRQTLMKMKDWAERLDAFLQFNGYNVLTHAGTVSKEIAEALAVAEYAKFRVVQDQNYESDFDKEVKKLTKKSKNKND